MSWTANDAMFWVIIGVVGIAIAGSIYVVLGRTRSAKKSVSKAKSSEYKSETPKRFDDTHSRGWHAHPAPPPPTSRSQTAKPKRFDQFWGSINWNLPRKPSLPGHDIPREPSPTPSSMEKAPDKLRGKDRLVNVWIDQHSSSEPVLVRKTYELMVNIGSMRPDGLISVIGTPLEEVSRFGHEVTFDVAITGDAFQFETQIGRLIVPTKGDSSPVAFHIRPIRAGSHNLNLLFYYKVNLLLEIAVPLEVRSKSDRQIGVTEKTNLLKTHPVASSENGIESIFEIEREI